MQNPPTISSLAKMIDHSLLHPSMSDQSITSGCELARDYQVATACVKPYATRLAKSVLTGSGVAVCAVMAFPHGNSTTAIKRLEALEAVEAGAILKVIFENDYLQDAHIIRLCEICSEKKADILSISSYCPSKQKVV